MKEVIIMVPAGTVIVGGQFSGALKADTAIAFIIHDADMAGFEDPYDVLAQALIADGHERFMPLLAHDHETLESVVVKYSPRGTRVEQTDEDRVAIDVALADANSEDIPPAPPPETDPVEIPPSTGPLPPPTPEPGPLPPNDNALPSDDAPPPTTRRKVKLPETDAKKLARLHRDELNKLAKKLGLNGDDFGNKVDLAIAIVKAAE